MIIRSANTRGKLTTDWIVSHRTFSNNSYWDPKYMNWNTLKVINDDCQQPGNMVPNHEHKNYDILGYMVSGELEHTDSLGNITRVIPGQIQHMWAGSSIWHTEASVGGVPARYLQIWFTPKSEYRNTDPVYEIISKGPDFDKINVILKQDITVSGGILSNEISVKNGYVYVVSGKCSVNGIEMNEGDGAELTQKSIVPEDNPHILLFEV